MTTLTKKEREELIEKTIESIDNWDVSDMKDFIRRRFRRDLEAGSDTLVALEYKGWVDSEYELP